MESIKGTVEHIVFRNTSNGFRLASGIAFKPNLVNRSAASAEVSPVNEFVGSVVGVVMLSKL